MQYYPCMGKISASEAAQVGIGIQREMASSVTYTRKVLILAGAALSGYVLLVVVFTALFIVNPLRTAKWLGIIKTKTNASLTQENRNKQVLGVETSAEQERNSLIQTVLQPIGKVSLGLVRSINPHSYAQVSKVAILDTNDVLGLDTSGEIIPKRPINLPDSSLLQVGSSGLVANLNSQYLQGRQPGTNPGDIAIIAQAPATGNNLLTLAATSGINSSITQGVTLTLAAGANITTTNNGAGTVTFATSASPTFTTINGLTLANNGTNTLNLAAGKTLAVNNSLTFAGSDGTTITFQGSDTYIGRTTSDTLTNKTISGLSNTISGLTNASLANSSFTTSGNSGSGSVALGGSLTFTGSGTTNVVASGSTLTFTSAEVDTLQSVYGRGNTITTTTGNGIIVDSSGATVTGIINGLKINAPTTIPSTGTYNSLNLGTSTSSSANSYDQATIAVGNFASTSQQNFSTLNITNGGTGFLDAELIRGFINFQGMNTLYDDFTSKSLNTADRWTSTSVGAGSNCSILAGGLNGLFRMHSGAGTNRGCELTTRAIGSLTSGYYQRSNNPIFETKLKIDTATNARIFAGFTDTRITAPSGINPGTNHAYIGKRALNSTWSCVTDDGGPTETTTDTAVTVVANTFYRLRVELRSGTTPETICTIDDGTTVTRTVVTATQPLSTSPMDVYITLKQGDAVAKNMDVDYVRAWQTDGNLAAASAAIDTTTTLEDAVASGSGSLARPLASSIDSFLKKLGEFFGNVIFHADVTFLGRPTFNKDTAGQALIKQGDSQVSIDFKKEYTSKPVVNVSVNMEGTVKPDEIPRFAVYDLSAKGFKIKLSQAVNFDLNFSWIALAINGDNMSTSAVSEPAILSPTPTLPAGTPQAQTPTPTVPPGQTPTLGEPTPSLASPSAKPSP